MVWILSSREKRIALALTLLSVFCVYIRQDLIFLGRSDAGELQEIEESISNQSITTSPQRLPSEEEWVNPGTAVNLASSKAVKDNASDAGELQEIEESLSNQSVTTSPQRLPTEEEWVNPETAVNQARSKTVEDNATDSSSAINQEHQERCKSYLSFRDNTNKKNQNRLPLRYVGRYVLTDEPPRYDYTCFAMKARYNCEPPPSNTTTTTTSTATSTHRKGETAADWRLVLQDPTNADAPVCDIRSVVDGAGGLSAVANAVRQRRKAFHVKDGEDDEKDSPVNIALLGNSFLRQLFEAFVCLFQDQITGGFFTDSGPQASLNATGARGKVRLVPKEDAGTIVPMPHNVNPSEMVVPPCHGASQDLAKYYHQGVPLNPTRLSPDCDDGSAMVELGGQLRIWFHFNPSSIYRSTQELVQHFGLNASNIDVMVSNTGRYTQILNQMERFVPSDVFASVHNWNKVLLPLKQIQKNNDGGRYFGADNPFIWTPPDIHPCMPGIPDDEVYLLLLSLLLDARAW